MKKEFRELIDKTNQGRDKVEDSDRLALAVYLQKEPDAWKEIGDISDQARNYLLYCIDNAVLVETTKHGLEERKRELGYESANGIERLLIENILNCWIQHHTTEFEFSRKMAGSITLTSGTYWEKRVTSSQRRYLRAIETLAKVRKMKLPSIQVNIAEKQVNVSS